MTTNLSESQERCQEMETLLSQFLIILEPQQMFPCEFPIAANGLSAFRIR